MKLALLSTIFLVLCGCERLQQECDITFPSGTVYHTSGGGACYSDKGAVKCNSRRASTAYMDATKLDCRWVRAK